MGDDLGLLNRCIKKQCLSQKQSLVLFQVTFIWFIHEDLSVSIKLVCVERARLWLFLATGSAT